MPTNESDVSGGSESENTKKITPELVQEVTNKVYMLFLKDLKRENERRRIRNPHYRR